MNLKKYKKLLNLILSIIFIIGTLAIFINTFYFLKSSNYNYQITRDSDYKVYLKKNIFYSETYLKANGYYPSLAISNYNINLKYNFINNFTNNITYKYKIEASLIGNLKSNPEKQIWIKKYTLKPLKEIKVTNNKFNILENIKIDYDYYNILKNNYERNYNLLLDAYLEVSLIIETNLDEYKINDKVNIQIYLGDDISYITKDYLEKENKDLIKKENNKLNYYFGILLIISLLSILCLNIKKDKFIKKSYDKEIKKIFRNYNEFLVTIENKPDLSDLKVIKLINFNDLIDIATLNNVNILYYEEIKKEKSNLYVIVNDYVYLYVIEK